MKNYSLFILLALIVGLTSCSTLRIEKRHYNGGWYVDFGNNKPTAAETQATESTINIETPKEATASGESENTSDVVSDVNTQLPAVQSGNSAVVLSSEEQSVAPSSETQDRGTEMNQNNAQKADKLPAESSPEGNDLALLVILAILVPPLAVYMVQGITPIFWITLLCWLFGGFFLFNHLGFYYLGGLGLLAIILALLVVFGKL